MDWLVFWFRGEEERKFWLAEELLDRMVVVKRKSTKPSLQLKHSITKSATNGNSVIQIFHFVDKI